MPTNAFTHKSKHPTDADLKERVGRPFQLLEKTVSTLQAECEGVAPDWKFSKTSGWYVTFNKKKKRLFYLFPTDGDFTFKIVFNDKCLAQIGKGSFPKYVTDMIQAAKKYPEGTLCVFDKGNFKVDTILDLLRIKIAN
jgi:hypothetical protein